MKHVTEQELIAHAEKTNGERVTLEKIERSIIREHYFTAAEGALGHQYCNNEDIFGVPGDLELLTFCVLVLWNGYSVVGQSACADPANFDEELGRRLARADAVSKVWPLMGYELKTNLKLGGADRPVCSDAPQAAAEGTEEARAARQKGSASAQVDSLEEEYGSNDTFYMSVAAERAQLVERFNKLTDFLHGPDFRLLTVDDQRDLRNQHFHMEGYKGALDRRLARAG